MVGFKKVFIWNVGRRMDKFQIDELIIIMKFQLIILKVWEACFMDLLAKLNRLV